MHQLIIPKKIQYFTDPNNDTKDFAHLSSPSIGDHLSTTNSETCFSGKNLRLSFLAKRNQCWGTKRSKLLMCKFRRSPVLLRIILILDLLWFTCLMGGTKSRAYSLNAEKFHGRKKEITNKTLPTGDNQHSSDFFQNHPTKILMNPPYMYIFHATRTPLPVVFEAKAYLTFHHGF